MSSSNSWPLRFSRIVLENLYSFKVSEVVPEHYNIVVGRNGVGKTNIVRTLRLLTGGFDPREVNFGA